MSATTDEDKIWQPATFLERGVAVPFTTPSLAGTRARPAGGGGGGGGGGGVELVMPNPSGGGVHIAGLADLRRVCIPTLHDMLLCENIAALPAITPRDIRRAARSVASDGAAGRAAWAAAAAADQADMYERLMANHQLLQILVKKQRGILPPLVELDRQAKTAIMTMAAQLGRPAASVTQELEALADLFATPGFGATAEASRCARLLGAMTSMQAALRKLTCGSTIETNAVALVISSADITAQLARRFRSDTQALLEDLAGLLTAWDRDPEGIAAKISRTEWMLDGWEQICLLWQLAPADRWRAAVSEMATMVPVIPHEAGTWLPTGLDDTELQRVRRMVHGIEEWRTGGLTYELVARNERMRAMAA